MTDAHPDPAHVMAPDVMAPNTDTQVTRCLMVVAQANDTFEDPVRGTLRTMSRSGGAEVTDENIAKYRQWAQEDAAKYGPGWTVKVAIVTDTVTHTTTYEEI